jgi:hypothetical protein
MLALGQEGQQQGGCVSKYVHCCKEGKGAAHSRRTGRKYSCRSGGKDRSEPPQDPMGCTQRSLDSSAVWGARTLNAVLHKVKVLAQKRKSIPTEFAEHVSVIDHYAGPPRLAGFGCTGCSTSSSSCGVDPTVQCPRIQ